LPPGSGKPNSDNHCDFAAHEIGGQLWQAVVLASAQRSSIVKFCPSTKPPSPAAAPTPPAATLPPLSTHRRCRLYRKAIYRPSLLK
jgi:hypothetical protein